MKLHVLNIFTIYFENVRFLSDQAIELDICPRLNNQPSVTLYKS